MIDQLIQLVYLVATALFVFSLHWMAEVKTARRGVFAKSHAGYRNDD